MQACAKADPRRCAQRMDCLTQCGLRDGLAKIGQFCIDLKLVSALKGDVQKGLFFRGAGALPFGKDVRSVRELIEYLLYRTFPAALDYTAANAVGPDFCLVPRAGIEPARPEA